MSLWLCLRFEQLPLQALRPDTQGCEGQLLPVVVLEKQRVVRACDQAAALGVRPDMGTATVRALAEDVRLLERDPQQEQNCLQQLCCWAYSITPTLYSWRQDCLLLEIGGCLNLFRGLQPLLDRIDTDLSLRGFSYCQGLAPTPKAAWLLSHRDDDNQQDPLEQRLAPLPLKLLDDFPRQTDALAKAGLWQFGDILDLSQQALGRRCGKAFTLFMQQVLGTHYDERPDFQPPQTFSDHYWFGYEVKANQELLPAMQMLLQSLCQFLRNAQLQCQQLEWQLFGIQRQMSRLQVRCSSSQADWQEWYRLTELKIEQLQLKTGVEGLALHCESLSAGHYNSDDLFNNHGQHEPLHSLLDRLHNRLGLQAVHKIACRDEHLPEYASYSSYQVAQASSLTKETTQRRPFWLMPAPQPLGQQRQQLNWNGPLQLLAGPERIEDNWWMEAISRDYYIAQNPAGQLYWVYRDRLEKQWFIQGVFA